jgi:hypothetical protein
MNRDLLFVLLVATGVVMADARAEAEQAAGAAAAQAKTETAQGEIEAAQVKTEAAQGQTDGAQAPMEGDAKLSSVPGGKALGMSILGNQEAPTSLVIVPWKTSELGTTLGISPLLDDSRQPVDKDVFMRALRYHEIRSGTTAHDGSTAGSRENAAAESGAAQSTASRRR